MFVMEKFYIYIEKEKAIVWQSLMLLFIEKLIHPFDPKLKQGCEL